MLGISETLVSETGVNVCTFSAGLDGKTIPNIITISGDPLDDVGGNLLDYDDNGDPIFEKVDYDKMMADAKRKFAKSVMICHRALAESMGSEV